MGGRARGLPPASAYPPPRAACRRAPPVTRCTRYLWRGCLIPGRRRGCYGDVEQGRKDVDGQGVLDEDAYVSGAEPGGDLDDRASPGRIDDDFGVRPVHEERLDDQFARGVVRLAQEL
ncbi:hypothetical protein GCM10020000_80630 [Streptomyces olivoverticillatus]